MFRVVSRVRTLSRVANGALRGGHHGPALPPFARNAPPTSTIPEEVELVWDDSVAPETAIDMEVPHVSTSRMFYSIGFVVACFAAMVGVIDWMEIEKNSPVAKRRHVVPYDGMKMEHGLLPAEEDA